MGAASSVASFELNEEETRKIVGKSFSEEVFRHHCNSSGCISKETLQLLIKERNRSDPPIYLLPFSLFCEAGEIPQHQDCFQVLEDSRVVDLSNSFVVYVSHVWMTRRSTSPQDYPHPDNPENEKYELCVKGIDRLWKKCCPEAMNCYLFLDYSCLNQQQNPAEELHALDKIFSLCHCMFTPIVDHDVDAWHMDDPHEGNGDLFANYKAVQWQKPSVGYLERSWCRLEMHYCKEIPLGFQQPSIATDLSQYFLGSLRTALMGANRRPHYLFGHREQQKGVDPVCLPPLSHQRLLSLDPLTGSVEYASDQPKIKSLLFELQLMGNAAPRVGYSGETNAANKPHGDGVHVYSSGSVYTGEWRQGKRHGVGKMVYASGDVFEGNFREGKRDGRGTFHWLQGDQYTGDWRNDGIVGEGTLLYANGNVYTGQFRDGHEDGKGQLSVHGGVIFDGQFRKGVFLSGVSYSLADAQSKEVQDALSRLGTNVSHGAEKESNDQEVYRFSDLIASPAKDVLSEVLPSLLEQPNDDCVIVSGKYFFADGSSYAGDIDLFRKEIHGKGKLLYASGEEYDGWFQHGEKHGKGKSISIDGDEYVGSWHHGHLCGEATVYYANGDVFEGHFLNGVKHGRGKLLTHDGKASVGEWKDGRAIATAEILASDTDQASSMIKLSTESGIRYEGQARDSLPHGPGKCTYPTGETFEGLFADGCMEGKGRLVFLMPPSGEEVVYEGSFKNGKFHGEGVMTFQDKSRYLGQFVDGRWEGQGRLEYPSGDLFVGQFRGNLKHGKGVFCWANGSKYDGDYYHNERSGQGRFTYPNGDEYIGAFSQGKKHGKGKFVWAESRSIYSGEYVNDARHGYGKHVYADGAVYEGFYKHNQKHGTGKLFTRHSGEEVFEGEFVKGKKHGSGRVTVLRTGEVVQVQYEHNQLLSSSKLPPDEGSVGEGGPESSLEVVLAWE